MTEIRIIGPPGMGATTYLINQIEKRKSEGIKILVVSEVINNG